MIKTNKVLYLLFYIFVMLVSANKNYGNVNIALRKFEFIKGPKQKDCSINISNGSSTTHVMVDIDVIENVAVSKGKVLATTDNTTIRLQINNPCHNVFVGPLFKGLFNVTNQCVVLKGHYKFNFDFAGIMNKYYSGKYFYGLQTFRSVFYGVNCNFVCTYAEIELTPLV